MSTETTIADTPSSTQPQPQMRVTVSSVSIDDFLLEERENVLAMANISADNNRRNFRYNNKSYSAKKDENGILSIFSHSEPKLVQPPAATPQPKINITTKFTAEELTEFKNLIELSKNTEDKVFNFKGENYKVTVDGNKTSTGLVHTSPPIH